MNDPRIRRFPEFRDLWASIPRRPRIYRKHHVEIDGFACPICGRSHLFIYDDDFLTYLCVDCYYAMYWEPASILRDPAVATGPDRGRLYRFIESLGAEARQAKFSHLTVVEIA